MKFIRLTYHNPSKLAPRINAERTAHIWDDTILINAESIATLHEVEVPTYRWTAENAENKAPPEPTREKITSVVLQMHSGEEAYCVNVEESIEEILELIASQGLSSSEL